MKNYLHKISEMVKDDKLVACLSIGWILFLFIGLISVYLSDGNNLFIIGLAFFMGCLPLLVVIPVLYYVNLFLSKLVGKGKATANNKHDSKGSSDPKLCTGENTDSTAIDHGEEVCNDDFEISEDYCSKNSKAVNDGGIDSQNVNECKEIEESHNQETINEYVVIEPCIENLKTDMSSKATVDVVDTSHNTLKSSANRNNAAFNDGVDEVRDEVTDEADIFSGSKEKEKQAASSVNTTQDANAGTCLTGCNSVNKTIGKKDDFSLQKSGKKQKDKDSVLNNGANKVKHVYSKQNIIVFDTETTGLDFENDEILSLGICDVDGNQLFSSYFKPEHKKSWRKASKVHGITPSMVKNSPYIKNRIDYIQKIFDCADVLIAYNNEFDLKFLKNAGLNIPSCRQIDVMKLFSIKYGDWNKYRNSFAWKKLTFAADYFGYDWSQGSAHDALSDARATAFVYRKMTEVRESEAEVVSNDNLAIDFVNYGYRGISRAQVNITDISNFPIMGPGECINLITSASLAGRNQDTGVNLCYKGQVVGNLNGNLGTAFKHLANHGVFIKLPVVCDGKISSFRWHIPKFYINAPRDEDLYYWSRAQSYTSSIVPFNYEISSIKKYWWIAKDKPYDLIPFSIMAYYEDDRAIKLKIKDSDWCIDIPEYQAPYFINDLKIETLEQPNNRVCHYMLSDGSDQFAEIGARNRDRKLYGELIQEKILKAWLDPRNKSNIEYGTTFMWLILDI